MEIRKIPLFKVFMSENVQEPLNRTLMSGFVGQGQQVDNFETLLESYIGSSVCTVNSGTSGIHLALRTIKEFTFDCRDEILTTPLTCLATNMPILAAGFHPRWVDVDPKTCNIDLDDLESKITNRTAGIMVVHWGGNPVNLIELEKIADRTHGRFGRNPPVIEDCAHAFGATYENKRIGNHGNICVFSFGPIKLLSTGDGGMITAPQQWLVNLCKDLRWYGLDRTIDNEEREAKLWGYKFHMNDINATIGISNFAYVQDNLRKHKENSEYYRTALAGLDAPTFSRGSSCWMHTLFVERRADFIKMMAEHGISVGQRHRRNDEYECFSDYKVHLPNIDLIYNKICCIPCGWWVTPEDREFIVSVIKKGW